MNVYDFDKTIYINDSSVDFVLYLYKKKPLVFFNTGIKSLLAILNLYVFHKWEKEKAKEVIFSILKYFDDREALINEFWDKHENGIKEFYLRQKRDDDLIISASPLFLIKPICQRLNINCLASPLNLETLKYEGLNCYGAEKVRVYKDYTNQEIDEFYSDSLSDSPLAQISKKAYLVKGNEIKEWPKEKL